MTIENQAAVDALRRQFFDATAPEAVDIVQGLDEQGFSVVDRASLCLVLGAASALLWQNDDPHPMLKEAILLLGQSAGIDIHNYIQGWEQK